MIDLTEQTFNEYINSQERVLVDFWATWCEPCRAMAPILEDLNKETITVAKVDVDSQINIAKAQGIRSMPTLVLYENGVEVNRLVGARPKNIVVEELGL